jgi:uncharacterized protein
MQGKLPRRYQVQKEVARNGCFEGEIPLSALSRLTEFLHSDNARQQMPVALRFEFKRNELDVPVLVGNLETCLELECQRCLDSMALPVSIDFQLMIDAGEELARESSLDMIDSDEGYIDIFEIIEDELILSIPLFASHDDKACNEHWKVSEPEASISENPFAVLQQLKTTE